jgi:putative ABC transport system permease protein
VTLLRVMFSRLASFSRRGSMEADLDRELQFHLQMESERLIQTGMSPEDSRRAALKHFGGVAQTKESYRATSGLPLIETIFQDLRYAARSLRKQPGFTAIAILTLALGIGANTAMYTVVDATMLRTLPFRDPDRLMRVSLVVPAGPGAPLPSPQYAADMVWSYPKYEIFRSTQHSFEDSAIYRPTTFNLTDTDQPDRLVGELVSASYFPLLGVRAEIGRTFLPEEDATPGKSFVAILSHGAWVNRYGSDPAILWKPIGLNQTSYTVIGVLPADFQGLSGPADIWAPAHSLTAQQLSQPFVHSWQLISRLKPGVSVQEAKAEVSALGPRIDQALPPRAGLEGWGTTARTLNEARLDPTIRKSILVLFGAVTFVLLIACVNLANLLLARGTGRRREIAIRYAVGATKARIIRYLLTESMLLAALGGAASLVLADAGVFALNLINPVNGNGVAFASRLSGLTVLGLGSIHLESRALLFTIGTALLTGLLFGMAPALAGAGTDVNDALKNGSVRPAGIWTFASKSALVIAEVALTMVLLVGAGLMLKSFERLIATRSGVNPENVLTAEISFNGKGFRPFFDQLEPRVANLPGVISVGLGDCYALGGTCSTTTVGFPDRPAPAAGAEPSIGVHWTSADYFKTMQIPLIRGRWFSSEDREDSRKVVILGETAAFRYWPGEDPIGRPIALGMSAYGDKDGAVVIGIVGDVRYGSMDQPPTPDAYVSHLQSPRNPMLLFVRAAVNPTDLVPAVRREVHALNKDVPAYDVKTMEQRIVDSTARARFSAILLAVFAAIAFTLAGIGIYGVMSYMVRQRNQEIGIRVALGATRQDVRRIVVRRAAILAGAGILIGLAGALAATRVLRTLLYEVKPSDPQTYLAISGLLVALATLASYLPARRASRVDPCVALRSE